METITAKKEADKCPQSLEQACCCFYAVAETPEDKTVQKFGEPIPGYSGVNRRVSADNVFGMTYAEARRMACESQKKITSERVETLRETSRWVAENKRCKE